MTPPKIAQQQAGVGHRLHRDRRSLRDHELQHFHAHAFGGKAGQSGAPGDAGEISGAIGFARPVGGMHAEETQDAQIILGDALAGIADEAHAPGCDIGKPADMVVHDAVGVDRKPVDGEVAPFGIADPVAAEGDLGLAAEGLDVLAQGRDLERMRVDHQRDGAVVDAGRHALDAGRPGAADDLVRQRRGRDVDVAGRDIEQRVADGAADHAGFLAIAIEQREHARGRTRPEPGRIRQHARLAHFSTPGISLPFSICAGT